MNRNQDIATTILNQLGGMRRVQAMTGAKNFVAIEDGLTFKVGRNANGVTHFTVRLTPADVYDVVSQRVHGRKVTEKARADGIYADMLRDTFEAHTGMYLTLV
jgi:hypothetical protein